MTEPGSGGLFFLGKQQQAFVDSFVEGRTGPRCLLIAPPGTGKTLTALACARKMALSAKASRILIMAEGIGVAQFARKAQERLERSATIIDRAFVREAISAGQEGGPAWPAEIIGISQAALFRHADVRSMLSEVPWDLVVVDDADEAPERVIEWLVEMSNQAKIARLLLLARHGFAVVGWPEGFVTNIVSWGGDTEISDDLRKMILSWKFLSYERSSEEGEFLAAVRTLADLMPPEVKKGIEGAAGSSVYAAEKSIRALRNSLVHGPGGAEDAVLAASKAMEAASRVKEDGALVAVFQELAAAPTPTIIVSSSEETARYLASALPGAGHQVSRLGDRVEEARAAIGAVTSGETVLVVTDEEVQGLDLRGVHRIIHFDLPISRAAFEARLEKIRAAGPTPKISVLLIDRSGTIPLEAQRRRELGIPERS